MLNFELYNPTNYIFGKNQIEKLANLIPAHAKVLLAYGGGSIFKNGIHKQVTEHLKGFELIEFGGIEPNPRFETLMKAVEIIRTEKITFILAVGGGSVIDGVKFISGAVNYEGNAVDILKNRILFKDISKVIPFGTVLTLPATGSEMNSGAVITIDASQEKLTLGGSALFPQFSICDPTVIQSLPKRQLQNGVVDAFTHILEQYLTYPQEALLQDRISEGILQTLVEIGPKVIENPNVVERYNIELEQLISDPESVLEQIGEITGKDITDIKGEFLANWTATKEKMKPWMDAIIAKNNGKTDLTINHFGTIIQITV